MTSHHQRIQLVTAATDTVDAKTTIAVAGRRMRGMRRCVVSVLGATVLLLTTTTMLMVRPRQRQQPQKQYLKSLFSQYEHTYHEVSLNSRMENRSSSGINVDTIGDRLATMSVSTPPAQTTTRKKKKKTALCTLDELVPGRWISRTYPTSPPYIPMRGEVQQKRCVDVSSADSSYTAWEWRPDRATARDSVFDSDRMAVDSSERDSNGAVNNDGGHSDVSDDDDDDCDFQSSIMNFKSRFCAVARGQTIAIIGDSISFDHFLSLTHLLGVPQSLPRAMKKTALLVSNIVCDDDNTANTNEMSGNTNANNNNNNITLIGKRDFYLHDLNSVLTIYRPDVLILNRGAHYTPDASLQNDWQTKISPAIQRWHEQQCLKTSTTTRRCWLIWRTSVPGHPDCVNYTRPFSSRKEVEDILDTHPWSVNFHWDQFRFQNVLVKHTLLPALNLTLLSSSDDALNAMGSGEGGTDVSVMDGYDMNILRGDAHRHGNPGDCLHTCLPGDDLYSVLLLHMFRLYQSNS